MPDVPEAVATAARGWPPSRRDTRDSRTWVAAVADTCIDIAELLQSEQVGSVLGVLELLTMKVSGSTMGRAFTIARNERGERERAHVRKDCGG